VARVTLINPRFEFSYWGFEFAMPIFGKRANLPSACLPLLAALAPPDHEVTLIDENVEAIDFDRAAQSDIVGLTGMGVQQVRQREIAAELKRRGVFTVAGGPWVTVQEDTLQGLADTIFVGEAEETWPQFLADWTAGRPQARYEQAAATDMSRVPPPRLDLLKMRHYMFGSLQFSRGCPYQCEFCDIIVTFGRRPRLKTWPQIQAELEGLLKAQMELVFVVDDNIIGNKKAIKVLLRELGAWQQHHGFPLTFFTETSLDLAEDAELLRLMTDANVQAVFIGIESPNEESLRETKKLQNLRAAPLVDRVRTIQRAGLDVWAGMIVGFDHDDPSIFAAQSRFLRESGIAFAMLGMLAAIPKTPLHARLVAEGRLDEEEQKLYGTNVVPLRMTRRELRDGYVRLMHDLYEPEAYFDRLEQVFLRMSIPCGVRRREWWHRHTGTWLKSQTLTFARSLVLFWRLMRLVPEEHLRRTYRRQILRLLRKRPDPWLLQMYLVKCATHYHYYSLSRRIAASEAHLVNTF